VTYSATAPSVDSVLLVMLYILTPPG
jgi:hypothetical protein